MAELINTVTWIVLCLFACIGLVQIFGWLVRLPHRGRGPGGCFHVVPLYDDPERLEAQIKRILSELRWGRYAGETVLLVNMGMGPEALRICDTLAVRLPGVFVCRSDELPSAIAQLDHLQKRA